MDGPSAINRLGTYGVPAIAAECVQKFFSAIMDSLKLNNMVAVDQLHPLLSVDLSAPFDKLGTLPPGFKAKTMMKEWVSRLSTTEAAP